MDLLKCFTRTVGIFVVTIMLIDVTSRIIILKVIIEECPAIITDSEDALSAAQCFVLTFGGMHSFTHSLLLFFFINVKSQKIISYTFYLF